MQRGLSNVDKVISRQDLFQVLDNFNREIIKDIAKRVEVKYGKEKGVDKISVRMPVNSITTVYADVSWLKEGDIVYFVKIGYARFDSKKNKEFWFCHI